VPAPAPAPGLRAGLRARPPRPHPRLAQSHPAEASRDRPVARQPLGRPSYGALLESAISVAHWSPRVGRPERREPATGIGYAAGLDAAKPGDADVGTNERRRRRAPANAAGGSRAGQTHYGRATNAIARHGRTSRGTDNKTGNEASNETGNGTSNR